MLIIILIFLSATASQATVPRTPETCVAHYDKNRFSQAAECFGALFERTGDTSFLYGSAYALYMGKHNTDALRAVRRFRARAPRKGDAWFLEGLILARLGRLESAREAFLEAQTAGLVNEKPKSLMDSLKNLERRIADSKRSRFNLSLAAGYDSKPLATDLGELVTSGEDPSVFVGIGASMKLPLLRRDLFSSYLRYSGTWNIYFSSETFSRGTRTPGQGGMMDTSTSAFGHSANDLGVDLVYGEFTLRLNGILRSFDPFFSENLAGFEGSAVWTRKGRLDTEASVGISVTSALSDTMEPFAGTAVKGLFLQEIPSPGRTITFLSLRAAWQKLGVSEDIQCDTTAGCPVRIPWTFIQAGGDLLFTVPMGSSMLGLSAGYQFLRQLEETTMDATSGSFSRTDHKLTGSAWFKTGKAPAWRFGLQITHNTSNADFQYYDLNYTRFIGTVSCEW